MITAYYFRVAYMTLFPVLILGLLLCFLTSTTIPKSLT